MVWMVGVVAVGESTAADEPSAEGQGARHRMEEVQVHAPADRPEGPFLPDVEGARIYTGKKTEHVDLTTRPKIVNNSYRRLTEQSPSLLVSEETSPLVSIGYRGLAPDRMQFMQVLKDGVPIQAEIFGYPEAYYLPPLESVDRVEFIAGGAGLMYGPQPGGAINFMTKSPATDTPAAVYTENSRGSDQLFSTYTSATGFVAPLGYRAYVHEREGNGIRVTNSDFEVIGVGTKVSLGQTTDSRLFLDYDEYHEEHGEPGGLTRAEADTAGRDITHRFFDRFRLERYYGTLRYERDLSEQTAVEFRTFGGHYRRYSQRQRGGGFGTNPTSSQNDIQEQDFYTYGLEPRVRHTYEAFGQEGQTLSAGVLAYFSDAPREDQRGETPGAESGALRNASDRNTQYLSLFAEHLFKFGGLSVTPGARLENVWQQLEERVNVDKSGAGTPLSDVSEFDAVPLFGLGVAYDVPASTRVYGNVSQGYRPKQFTQAVPTGATQVVNSDLEEGKSVTLDLGVRGRPMGVASWDASYFLMYFEDQIGTSGNTVANVGDARHQGVELAADVDLVGVADAVGGTDRRQQIGSFSPFATLMLLDAEFTDGPQNGKRPQYAPQYLLRMGAQYDFRDRAMLRLSSVFLDDHFGDDANAAALRVPSYKVWDLSGEVRVYKDYLTLFGGVSNLFDERYFARVTSGGIDPAPERNVYGGLRVGVKF
jgi:Fe(3+) dicitrate transport protein